MKSKKIKAIVTGIAVAGSIAIVGPSVLAHADSINKVSNTESHNNMDTNNQMNGLIKAVSLKTGKVVAVAAPKRAQSFAVTFNGYPYETQYNKYHLHGLKNQDEFHSTMQEKLYEYLLNPNNRWNTEKGAMELHNDSGSDDCAYFVSTALRGIGVDIPYSTANCLTLQGNLNNLGWVKMYNFNQLRAGDICFAGTDGAAHTFVFMGWANKANQVAWIADSQAWRFGNNMHVRGTFDAPGIDSTVFFYGGPGADVSESGVNTNASPQHLGLKAFGVGVTTSNLNVRSGPSENDSIIGSFNDGTPVQIFGEENGWYKINYNGGIGYIQASEVDGNTAKDPNNITITKEYPEISKGTINQYTWAMSTASWNDNHMADFDEGQAVTITGYEKGSEQQGGWYRVDYQGGSVWVPANRINTDIRGTQYNTIDNGLINNLDNNYAWIMSSTSKDGVQLGKLNNGTPIKITGEDGAWYRIDYMQTSGWIPKNSVDNPANYSVKKLDETGIIDFSLGYTDTKNIPTWYGVKTYTLNNGTKVHITGEHEGWYRLDVNGVNEWVLKERVKVYKTLGTGTVTFPSYGGSCILDGPSWNTNIVKVLNDGSSVKIIGERENWYNILTENGQVAWIPKNRLITSLNKNMLGTGTTNVYTNVQENPSWGGQVLGVVNKGEAFNIISEKNGWYEVDYNNGTGWIEGNRLNTSLNKNMKSEENAVVDFNGYTDLTYGPSWNSDIAGTLNNGTTVQVVGQANGWTRINYKNTTAWLPSNRLKALKVIGKGKTNIYTDIQKNPSWGGSVLGIVNKGESFNIISEKNGWYEVDYKNETGWIEGNRLDTSLNKNMKPIKTGTIDFNNYTYATYGPSWGCDIAGSLEDGAKVQIVGEANGWYRINYKNSTAWVLKDRIQIG
ncbi:MAG: SH3 domain-containing protein [Clostridium sp.]|uniref:SH3 domain-containing protein n=1 Tax=Clostridium sp. TaxID=1506 RepID=UPI003F3F5E78